MVSPLAVYCKACSPASKCIVPLEIYLVGHTNPHFVALLLQSHHLQCRTDGLAYNTSYVRTLAVADGTCLFVFLSPYLNPLAPCGYRFPLILKNLAPQMKHVSWERRAYCLALTGYLVQCAIHH